MRSNRSIAATAALLACAAVAAAQPVLLRDDFKGNTLDRSVWFQPTGVGTFLGRTQMRPPSVPVEVSGGVLRLDVDTHNPSALVPGDSFFGSEVRTIEVFELGEGLIFEHRARWAVPAGASSVPGGLVGAMFTFVTNGFIRDEVDFEILTNFSIAGDDPVLTNVFVDDDFSQPGNGAVVFPDGVELTDFNTYRIEWTPDSIRWLINGVLVREETSTVPDGFVPPPITDPLRVHLNAWAPDQFFAGAFSGLLQPVPSAAANDVFTYEVDYIEIRRPEVGPCGPADVATTAGSFGTLDGNDIAAFVSAFVAADLGVADIAATGDVRGTLDGNDIAAFVSAFLAGCG